MSLFLLQLIPVFCWFHEESLLDLDCLLLASRRRAQQVYQNCLETRPNIARPARILDTTIIQPETRADAQTQLTADKLPTILH